MVMVFGPDAGSVSAGLAERSGGMVISVETLVSTAQSDPREEDSEFLAASSAGALIKPEMYLGLLGRVVSGGCGPFVFSGFPRNGGHVKKVEGGCGAFMLAVQAGVLEAPADKGMHKAFSNAGTTPVHVYKRVAS